ncbi:RagB/SusD family nutrient uptake outer membrane protein [Dinghuibacter silviterrae]|uniref:Putative outer membrane starch-binding protein n=1 Tax=Dinghuibacter silviterrae TaxID=1539049 RepID=A0A4R8DHR5_9BACT|nr:RagB/SusD family nutrient uptake outer membrane protein [Dinghuibacter silviterrae]TDW97273.1 putative outer membrane starch-binding protein [Dinghuibacter silviterrae]
MKTRYFVIPALMASVFGATSCKKNFLDIQTTSVISNTAVLGDSTLFEDYVINRYIGATLQNKEGEGTPPGFGRGFEYSMWSSVTDESIYNNDDNSWLIVRGQLAPENLGIASTIWARSYRSIREINFAINNIGQVQMSAGHKQELLGELHFQRAFRYQDLIRNYGGVVLMGNRVIDLDSNLQDPSLYVRSSIKDCIDYAVSELDSATQYLPAANDGTSWLLGRATKGAAMALKARLLLYAASPLYNAGTWADAAAAAQAVINLGKYSLEPIYGNLFLNSSANSNEIIFERLYTIGARHVCLEIANGPNGYGGWAGNTPLQNFVDSYQMSNGKTISDPTSGYDSTNPYVNRDPRFYATVLYNGSTYRGRQVQCYTPGGLDSKDGPSNWNTTKTGYYLRKFMDDNNPINNPWNVAGIQPWIYIRYAEILLDYAEAQNEASGPDATVYSAINQIRTRAGMPNLPAGLTQSEMRTAVWNERQVELAFEEHRFYDVRRWKIADSTENVPAWGINVASNGAGGYTYTRQVALSGRLFLPKDYWLPIPRTEILASNNQLQQNTGY